VFSLQLYLLIFFFNKLQMALDKYALPVPVDLELKYEILA